MKSLFLSKVGNNWCSYCCSTALWRWKLLWLLPSRRPPPVLEGQWSLQTALPCWDSCTILEDCPERGWITLHGTKIRPRCRETQNKMFHAISKKLKHKLGTAYANVHTDWNIHIAQIFRSDQIFNWWFDVIRMKYQPRETNLSTERAGQFWAVLTLWTLLNSSPNVRLIPLFLSPKEIHFAFFYGVQTSNIPTISTKEKGNVKWRQDTFYSS